MAHLLSYHFPLLLPLPPTLCTPILWPNPTLCRKQQTVNLFTASILLIVAIRGVFYGCASFPPATVLSADLVGTLWGAYKLTSLQSGLCKSGPSSIYSQVPFVLIRHLWCWRAGGQRKGLPLPPSESGSASLHLAAVEDLFWFLPSWLRGVVWIFLIGRQSTSFSKLGVCEERRGKNAHLE